MALDDLRQQGLLLPEEEWGETPDVSWRSRAQIVVCGGLFLGAALLIWLGDGGTLTFVGLGIFLVDLVLFQVFTFQAVDYQVGHLMEIGVGGRVEGLPADDEA